MPWYGGGWSSFGESLDLQESKLAMEDGQDGWWEDPSWTVSSSSTLCTLSFPFPFFRQFLVIHPSSQQAKHPFSFLNFSHSSSVSFQSFNWSMSIMSGSLALGILVMEGGVIVFPLLHAVNCLAWQNWLLNMIAFSCHFYKAFGTGSRPYICTRGARWLLIGRVAVTQHLLWCWFLW